MAYKTHLRQLVVVFPYLALLLKPTTVVAFDFTIPKAPSLPFMTAPPPKTSNEVLLGELESLIDQGPRNGIDTPIELEEQIQNVCQQLEYQNPTKSPVRQTSKMNGFWKMRWTNFTPAAPSCGKLGPFVGDVFQDIQLNQGFAKNILKIDFPPIAGELTASANVINDSTMAITFETVGNKVAGVLPLGPKIQFEQGKEVRLWEHVYLDDNYRILYAKRQQDKDIRGFLYVMKRADDERFETNV